MFSPEVEAFSTPPTTPMAAEHHPVLSRRSSRPSNLRIQYSASSWTPEIQVDSEPSPNAITPYKSPTGATSHANRDLSRQTNGGVLSSSYPDNHPVASPAHRAHPSPITSPCFVHSQLQVQGASPNDWARARTNNILHDKTMGNVSARKTDMHPFRTDYPDGTLSEPQSPGSTDHNDYGVIVEDDDEEYTSNLTRQLAETAVGVREMSKQLGRTRVRSNIQSVLIVTKARDNRLIKLTRDLALYLMLRQRQGKRGMIVYVDAQLRTSRRFDAAGMEREHPQLFVPFPHRRSSSSSSLATSHTLSEQNHAPPEGQLRYWTADMCSRDPDLFDFVITLGGDGTVLFTSWLFQRIVPPVLPFALGSLGFLTNFDFSDHQEVMDNVIDNGLRVNLRMRFTCTVYRAVAPEEGKGRRAVKKGNTGEILMRNVEKDGWEALESGYPPWEGKEGKCGRDKEIMCFSTRPVESFEVLNDLVVDRGPSPYVSLLELFGDEHHLTTVQADGLTISTPTGSTAYSLSAGGSLVHPEIPAILITPICPHTLSFRPMLLPDSMELRICVPFNSRSTAWASFDGRGRVELKQGDHIKVTASKYPFPTVCADTQSTDWFHSISRTLKWNERERQKSFVVVEESPSRKRYKHRKFTPVEGESPKPDQPGPMHHKPHRNPPHEDAIEDEEEEDEVSDEGEEVEEKFDIDDLSSNDSSPTGMEAVLAMTKVKPSEEKLGREKVFENAACEETEQARAEVAARALYHGSPYARAASGLQSGVETPDRFAGPHPHPPKLSPRHVAFASSGEELSASEASVSSRGEHGLRDEIYSPRMHAGARSRIPRDRELEMETMKTPTAQSREGTWRRNLSRSRSRDRSRDSAARGGRAFAVWGQDESDSATSDSDA